ncbi:hypothetical protein GGS23DRAFT_563522 [Durotheca rogersii]|uniref:uncharacterized protein n=1 Tax=Durotheca rogersii TaxID=419775 RepID=UPI00221EA005|nr:uncharacterized protein GGS23DRAFT_563522 [Durotheca rogersii]KAI5864253.1 hypothetical protein GGS23DRAFT_563522 [Durotheca rogersii]
MLYVTYLLNSRALQRHGTGEDSRAFVLRDHAARSVFVGANLQILLVIAPWFPFLPVFILFDLINGHAVVLVQVATIRFGYTDRMDLEVNFFR